MHKMLATLLAAFCCYPPSPVDAANGSVPAAMVRDAQRARLSRDTQQAASTNRQEQLGVARQSPHPQRKGTPA